MKQFIYLILLTLTTNINAEQKFTFNYDQLASDLFWSDLYAEGGWTLYCGLKFSGNGTTINNNKLVIEHIFPVNKMISFLNCDSRMQCRDSGNKKFIRMEADLHNLYPVWQNLHNFYYDSNYGVIKGENWRYDGCDFERKNGVAEPRPLARGNIARSIFYMHYKYGVPIGKELLSILKEWNDQDPPSKHELQRNSKIKKIQGNKNPYINNPKLAEKIIAKD